MKIIIAGTRTFSDEVYLTQSVEKTLRENKIKNPIILSGMAKGPDLMGKKWAIANNYQVKEFPADWKNLNVENCVIKSNQYGKYNALAGHNRNKQMGDEADMLIAFWDGKSTGTKHMIEYMEKNKKTINIFYC